MTTSIEGIMCLWNEEDNVARAIESTKDFVDSYIVVDNSDDGTLDIVRGCQQLWGLDMRIFYKPDLPDLAEKRYWAMCQSEADWLMFVDGDHVYHTDGPNDIAQIRPLLEARDKSVWFSTSIWIWGPPGSFATWRKPWGKDEPILIPHPFLYRNSHDLKPCLSYPTADLPHLPGARRVDFPNQPVFWDVCCKNRERSFLRGLLVDWRTDNDYERFPTLSRFAQHKFQVEDLEPLIEKWWDGKMAELLPYDPAKWGYYPKTLRKAMGEK